MTRHTRYQELRDQDLTQDQIDAITSALRHQLRRDDAAKTMATTATQTQWWADKKYEAKKGTKKSASTKAREKSRAATWRRGRSREATQGSDAAKGSKKDIETRKKNAERRIRSKGNGAGTDRRNRTRHQDKEPIDLRYDCKTW